MRNIHMICEHGHESIRNAKDLIKIQNYTCTVCSGKVLSDDNRLDLKYPHVINEWDYQKNKIKPSEIAYNSNKEVFWKCNNNHSWKSSVSYRTGTRYKSKNESPCPFCFSPSKSRSEIVIYSELHQFFENVISGYKKDNKEIDILIEDLNLGIEYDGAFSHRNKFKKDLSKNLYFQNNNIKIIRIREKGLKLTSVDDLSINPEDDIYLAIEFVLDYILKNYTLKNDLKEKIKTYLQNKKATNLDFFEQVKDKYRVKKITNKIMFRSYHKSNHLPLHYYGAGSDFKALWTCKNNHIWECKIRKFKKEKCPICEQLL